MEPRDDPQKQEMLDRMSSGVSWTRDGPLLDWERQHLQTCNELVKQIRAMECNRAEPDPSMRNAGPPPRDNLALPPKA